MEQLEYCEFRNIKLKATSYGIRNIVYGLDNLCTLILENVVFTTTEQLELVIKHVGSGLKELIISEVSEKNLVLNLSRFEELLEVDIKKMKAYIKVEVHQDQSFTLLTKKKFKKKYLRVNYFF
jgi:hypothetical protein